MFKPTFFDDNDPNNPKRKTYIERKALIKDIDETVVFTVREGTHLPTSEMRGANKVIDRIKSAPTADVVEVVRCRNCKYFNNQFNICKQLSPRDDVVMNEDDFCSYGERKLVMPDK